MATCTTTIDAFLAVDGTLDVIDKYENLMKTTVGDDSIYMKAKDTMYYLFKDLQITEAQKAEIVAGHVAQMTNELSKSAMDIALSWDKDERDGAYALAKVKADTEVALAQYELVKSQICKTDKETALACAQITATTSASVRENGRVLAYGDDGCTVESLQDEGLKYHQTKQVEADTYARFADAFRKSGVVQIGVDISDGETKGLSGDEDGYTWQQMQNAERQRIAYEDSKRNHVANSTASMIGQMLSAEIAPVETDIAKWRDAIDYLNTSHSSTSSV